MSGITKTFLFLVSVTFLFQLCGPVDTPNQKNDDDRFLITAKGDTFQITEPSAKMLEQYESAKSEFLETPNDVEKVIWHGRRTAYLGHYYQAIKIYSAGIEKFPEDPRLYRHRGHRFISVRDFDKAIADLEKAAQLVAGTDNEIEPDGMPNAQNIPVSTLHGNIWYHLGLAYYLKHNYPKSFECFLNCRNTGSNDDNIVSSTHWLYMNAIRMQNDSLAQQVLEPIEAEAEIIENFSYHQLCLLYKELLPVDSLEATIAGSPSGDALRYGLANWKHYQGDVEGAKSIIREILAGNSWSSFGFIAAESDDEKYFSLPMPAIE
jgi:tetratricopeptide (TPR) repeat protein